MAIVNSTRGDEGLAKLDDATTEKLGGTVLRLPSMPSEPKTNFQDYVMLIYGEKKIGKTSLAARFPNALFLMFEVGGKALSIYQMDVGKDWNKLKEIIKLLKTSEGDKFGTIVIDTIDLAYEACFAAVCKRGGFSHPSDENDFGKSWGLIEKEFTTVMLDLMAIGKGVVFLSHAKQVDIKTRSFGTFNQVVPTLGNQAAKFVVAASDVLAYYGYFGEDRYLIIRGNDNFQAGCRLERNFLVSEHAEKVLDMLDFSARADGSADDVTELEQMGAELPDDPYVQAIPMGRNAVQAYSNLMRAFRNEQDDPHKEVTGMGTLTDSSAMQKVAGKGK